MGFFDFDGSNSGSSFGLGGDSFINVKFCAASQGSGPLFVVGVFVGVAAVSAWSARIGVAGLFSLVVVSSVVGEVSSLCTSGLVFEAVVSVALMGVGGITCGEAG